MADDAAISLPYVGDDPAALLEDAASRLSDARACLARAGDTLFDARTQLRTAWRGVAAGAADEQLGLIISRHRTRRATAGRGPARGPRLRRRARRRHGLKSTRCAAGGPDRVIRPCSTR